MSLPTVGAHVRAISPVDDSVRLGVVVGVDEGLYGGTLTWVGISFADAPEGETNWYASRSLAALGIRVEESPGVMVGFDHVEGLGG